jgi:hypothetical protein
MAKLCNTSSLHEYKECRCQRYTHHIRNESSRAIIGNDEAKKIAKKSSENSTDGN